MSNPSAMKQTLTNAKASLDKMKASANNQGNQQDGQQGGQQGRQQSGEGSKDPAKMKQALLTRIAKMETTLTSISPKNEKIEDALQKLQTYKSNIENTSTSNLDSMKQTLTNVKASLDKMRKPDTAKNLANAKGMTSAEFKELGKDAFKDMVKEMSNDEFKNLGAN